MIPNEAAAAFADQAEPDSVDFDFYTVAHQRTGVISGCAVTAQGSPDMTVAVAAGVVESKARRLTVTSGNVTIGAADATNPRFDLVTVNSSGAKTVVAGTAASNPVFPALPDGSVPLAAVYVPANDTAINANQITDKRIFLSASPLRDFTAQDVVNTTTETAIATFTIPANLLGTDRLLRCVITGELLNNSGATATGTLRVKLGATTIFADASPNIAAGANARPFHIQFDLANLGATNSQWLGGLALLGAGATAAPTSGIGDLAATAIVIATFGGSAAVDTTADVTLEVTWQHSTANANLRITPKTRILSVV